MEEKLIKYTTAKFAKEKGIDISQFSNSVMLNNGCVCDKMNSCITDEHKPYYTCTQSLLQWYFREKHNIHTSIYRLNSKWASQLFDIEMGYYVTNHVYAFNYENALEDALRECLNYIQ